MTWKDIKLATLQKMFAADGTVIPTDESTAEYLNAMPYVANEGLVRLATAGKFITKSLIIAHTPLANILPDNVALSINEVAGTLQFEADACRSYAFDFSGKGTLVIEVNGATETIYLDSKGTYTHYNGLVSNSDGRRTTFTFNATYPSTVKNIGLYTAEFDNANEVPEYAVKVQYNLKELAPDFYQLGENQIYYEGGNQKGYLKLNKYYREGDKVLVLERNMPGSYTVYYRAYPPEIKSYTDDDYELPLDRELAVLLPLYMASQLYKDDDNGIATSYRNEFEVGLESLIDTSVNNGYEQFTSESGWS